MKIGSKHPVVIQGMLKGPIDRADLLAIELEELKREGAEIVRLAVPNLNAFDTLRRLTSDSPLPIIADIHFQPELACKALDAGARGIRLNPGNTPFDKRTKNFLKKAADCNACIRLGVNSGSAFEEGETLNCDQRVEKMVDLVLNAEKSCRDAGLVNVKASIKCSDLMETIAANKLLAGRCDLPLHVGITAAGSYRESAMKSALGIGHLLIEGIGDTLRVSATGGSVAEIQIARRLLEIMHFRPSRDAEIVSCPTCSRCAMDIAKIVEELSERMPPGLRGMKIAVMGCVVNGPGEAREADVGIAGGRGYGYLFSKGKKLKRVSEENIVDELILLIEEIRSNGT